MRKPFIVLLSIAASISAPLGSELLADVTPPVGLAPGSPYQLIFVTNGTRDASSSNIVDYNNFVTVQALLSVTLPVASWTAVATTSTVNAVDNAPSIPGVPVYNTNGDLVANGASGLYAVSLTNPINYDQNGALRQTTVWTGDITNGGSGFFSLGEPDPFFGHSAALNRDPSGWNHYGNVSSNAGQMPLYALSSVITTPVPEPGTIMLLLGAISAGALRRTRRVGSH